MAEKTTPTFPQYTNLALGEGLFDQLMTTVNFHLDQEFKKQRIRGTEYSKVYLGSMESVMLNTTQYLLGSLLIEQQKAKLIVETLRLELENEKLEYEIEHLLPLTKLLTQAQIDKITAEISLLGKQEDKIDKEILFLTAKINTENANVSGTGISADSVIGRQIALLKAQKLGFAGDLQLKAGKLFSDYDVVFQTTQENPADVDLTTITQTQIALAQTTASDIKAIP